MVKNNLVVPLHPFARCLSAAIICFAVVECSFPIYPGPGNPPEAWIVRQQAKATAGVAHLQKPLEISSPQIAALVSPGSWVVCVRSAASNSPNQYAMFFRDNKFVDARTDVSVDRCEIQTYTPLE